VNTPPHEMHRLDIADDGTTTVTHPDVDIEDCGFSAYVAADWEGPGVPRPSSWAFTRTENTGGVVWSGTRLDPPAVN
jgi:hypothetical protein